MDLHEQQMRAADDRAQSLRDAYQIGSRPYRSRGAAKSLGDFSYFEYAESRLEVVEKAIQDIEAAIPVLEGLKKEREVLRDILKDKPEPDPDEEPEKNDATSHLRDLPTVG